MKKKSRYAMRLCECGLPFRHAAVFDTADGIRVTREVAFVEDGITLVLSGFDHMFFSMDERAELINQLYELDLEFFNESRRLDHIAATLATMPAEVRDASLELMELHGKITPNSAKTVRERMAAMGLPISSEEPIPANDLMKRLIANLFSPDVQVVEVFTPPQNAV